MAGITLGRGAYAPYFRAAEVPIIHQDKSVAGEIIITNIGDIDIPPNVAEVHYYYAPNLSSMTGDCQADEATWSTEVKEQNGISRTVGIPNIMYPGVGNYYQFIESAADIPQDVIDAGFVILLDTDEDGVMDTYADCILVVDAFKIVAASKSYKASLESSRFFEVVE